MIEDRIHNPSRIDKALLHKELSQGREMIIQFSYKKYDAALLSTINSLCRKYKENLCIRFFDHGKGGFNANTLLQIPEVKNLCIDYLGKVSNMEALASLHHLVLLDLGVLPLTDPEFLRYKNLHSLKSLSITETSNCKVNLEYLARYSQLIELHLDDQIRNIDSLGKLKKLKTLSLRAIKKTGLGFINEMKGLKTLNLLLGGRSDLNEIVNSNIRELSIKWVLGFNDVSGILKWEKLETVDLSLLKQLQTIRVKAPNHSIKELTIGSCKNLKELEGLNHLKALKKLAIIETAIPFDDFIRSPLPPSLKEMKFITTNSKKDKEIRDRITSLGYISVPFSLWR